MSESLTSTTKVAAQYSAQVNDDLERNAKEQESLSSQVAALQEQLTALQHDQSVLVSIQQALGGVVPTAEATVPVARTNTAAQAAGGKNTPVKKAAAAQAAKAAAAKGTTPTLVELVRRHLLEQSEPRSAAEVSAALTQAHPERLVQTTVVRNTLEGLVAKHRAQRTKQGSSVYYTPPGVSQPVASAEPTDQTEKA
ncbi:hypothetical protein [Streptomyces sp. NBC_00887]|uniref:hypothetical protein n=1 Tax=Streptomyces sp. NBC_00887 TaxID=2975859 RepID=UPI003865BF2F